MKLRKRITTWVAAVLALTLGLGGLGLTQAYAAAGDVPAHDKSLIVNADGTYTLALNVKGDSEKDPQKVNVVVVFDTSSSMNKATGNTEVTYTTTDWDGGWFYQDNLYGLIDGEYRQLSRTNSGSYWNPSYHFWYNGTEYTGQRYFRQEGNQTRLQAAEAAVNNLAAALLAYNTQEGNDPDTVEMALVDFANTAEIAQAPTTSYSAFEAVVNSRNAGNNDRGTNWEAGLRTTLNVDFEDEDPTYVIFVSDGNPTFYMVDPENTQRGGTGQEGSDNISASYNQAVPAAQEVVDAGNVFYTIGIYGNVDRMQGLTTASGAPEGNYYSAEDTAALQEALAEILAKIETAGIGKVGISDGTTSSVTTTTGEVSHLLTVDENSYKYYRAGGTADSGTGEKYDSTANGGLGEEWDEAPAATFENGAVKWNIDEILENDVTYTVTFDCWPSQTTLDIVADLKNDPSSYDSLDPNIKQYIDANGDLKTNTTATLSYTDTRTGQSGSSVYDNPDPVQTAAVESLALAKEWENELDGKSAEPITLTVTRDGVDHHTVTLSEQTGWEASTYISIGIMRNEEVLEPGHDFTFIEPADLGYYWELQVPTIRPMLVDGTLTMLIFKDSVYTNPDGAKEYTIDGKTYYVGSTGAANLTATNERRSTLDLTKAVDGPDADPAQTFPFTLNVVDSKAADGSADNLNSDYYVWFSVRNGDYVDAVVSGANKEMKDGAWTGYYYAPSGTDIVVNLKAGDNLRFINLPTGTTYTLAEGTLPANYEFVSSKLSGGTATFSGAQTSTGTIQETNTNYTVTYTNRYDLSDVEITKVWKDNNNQDGLRPTAEEFVEYLVLKADGTDVTADNADKLTVTVDPEDSNKYIAKWAGLDRFADGEEIAYTVEETEIEGYTTTGSPAEDNGTITNTHEPEVTKATVKKVWDDAENQDGERPESLTVTLSNGDTVTLNEANGWEATVENLPKYAAGQEIAYTWTEGDLPEGYELTNNTTVGTVTTLTNSHVPEKDTLTVTKVWDDASDQDGIRPDSVAFTVTGSDGKTYDATLEGEGDTWTAEVEVDKYTAGGTEVTFTVDEAEVANYTKSIDNSTLTITNSHVPEKDTLTVTKVWDDASDQDGIRPDSVAFTVTGSDGKTYDATLSGEGDTWTAEVEVDKYTDGGTEVTFTVDEADVANYTKTIDNSTLTITNSYTPEVTELTVTKVWDDASNQDGVRPQSVAFTVTGDDGNTYDATLEGEGDTWTATIENVAKYHDGGTEVTFTVDEADVDNYTKSIDNSKLTITNSYTTKVTEATVTKVWDDADNQDGIRPGELKVTLSNGTEVTLNAENNWTATVNNLPMYKDGGQLITYTWNEGTLPEGYKLTNTSTEGTVTTLTNSHTPEETEATVKKVWSDADNQDGIRPASLEVTLSNGTKVTLSDSNEWTATVSKLPKYAAGQEIAYTWTEASVDGYTLTSTDKQGTVTTLTNSHTPEETEATVKKVWDDADNQDGYRPGSITVTLSDGQTVTLSEENDWTATITGLPKYAAGEEIKYTWTEADIEHYTLSDSKAEGTVTTLTNSHTPEVVNVSVEKVWEDAENQDSIRPESVQVQLKANDVATGDPVTLDASNEWAYTWENLDKKAAGEDIAYTVEEVEVPEGYDDETTGTQAEGYLVTNVHEPETTEITVSKVWDDADDQDGYRPASVTVNLYADGEATGKSVALNEGNNWTNTFTDLFVNKPGEVGQAITYSIDENKVEQYTVAIDGDAATGFTVTNSHTPEKTEVPVTKVWDDADNQDGIRPATITVALLANGADTGKTVTLSADNEWADTFTDLDKKAAGKDIAYTVAEVSVEGYTSETTGTAAEGYVITNRHTPEVTDVPVTKVWDDADDQDGIRLANVVVKLLADGADTGKTVTLNEANGWKATFTGVDKYAAGAEIAYTVAEDAPAGYQVAVSGDAAAGYTVTNTHTPELTEVKVTKVWSDADDQDGIRPADVTVKLLADGADTGKAVTLSADNEWAGTFAGLDKYAAGELVKYTVEEDPVADYAVAVAGDAAEGFTVTNSHTPGTTAVNVKKVWDDGSNHDGIRPASVTVELLADGEATGKTVTLDESNGWAGSFVDLQKNAAGKAVKYTVEEKAVEGYAAKVTGSAVDGFTVTNYHKVAEAVMIDPPVQKVIKVPVGTKPAAATFTFQMKAISEGAPMPEGSVSGVKTMTIEGAGSKEFGEVWIDMPGTYVYELTEVKGDAKGYAYDATAYTLTVEVTRNADGDLVKTETITDASGKKVEKVVFTNTFTPEPPVLPQTSDDSVPASTLVVTALTGVALVAAGSALRLRKEN